MSVFKTLDLRGLSFFSGFEQTQKAFRGVKVNGVLEVILDPQKNFTHAFREWAQSEGHSTSDIDENNQMIRLFIRKVSQRRKN
jgi:TusA-related sulfurtransferase